jgi:hypothetical protein
MVRQTIGWAFLLLLPVAPAWGYTHEELVERTVPATGIATLSVRNINGSISVQAWDRPEIQIKAKKVVKRSDKESAEELARKIEIAIETVGDRVEVETRAEGSKHRAEDWVDAFFSLDWLFSLSRGGASVEYTLSVPARLDVDLGTTNGNVEVGVLEGRAEIGTVNGNVEVEGLKGRLDAHTVNGNITARALEGAAEAETVNGNIEAEFVRGKVQECDFETVNGNIEVRLPESVQADLDAKTVNGSIVSELPLSLKGEIKKHHIQGQLNGGGPRLEFSTTNGGIEITKASP